MSRHRVATLGRPGPAWPRAVARWGSSATLPVDATTCVSAEELRSLVQSTPVTLAIVEAGLPGVDRVLADAVRSAGAALAVVHAPALADASRRLAPDAVLAPDFGAESLAAVLAAHVRTTRRDPGPSRPSPATDRTARLLAVTGPSGGGTSTVAQALSAALARRGREALLADLALRADQHVRHGLAPGLDGVFELAEALRHAPPEAVRPQVRAAVGGYDVLPGLRRRREWVAVSPAVLPGLLAALTRDRDDVVADVDDELDGRSETGSVDLEERNALARAVVDAADRVVVVGRWTTTGLPRLVQSLVDVAHHVPRDRVVPVLSGTPRNAPGRTAAVRALDRLLTDAAEGPWPPAVPVSEDRGVEPALREARPLPRRLVAQVDRVLDRC